MIFMIAFKALHADCDQGPTQKVLETLVSSLNPGSEQLG